MPSSSSSSHKPILPARIPLHATNSWVINRARELIDYDKYDAITKWIDEVSDEENGKKPSTSKAFNSAVGANPDSSAVRILKGHPAGELEDYDPDCHVLSQMTVIEALEAMAAKTEVKDCSDDGVSSASSSSSYYQSIVSGSLSREPLLDECKQPDSTVDVEAETVTDSVEDAVHLPLGRISPSHVFPSPTPPPPPSLGPSVLLELKMGESSSRVADEDQMSVGTSQTVIRHNVPGPTSKPSKLSKLSTLFRTPSSSFLTVPRPTAQARKGKLGRKEKDPSTYKYPYTYEYPSAYPEIERGASPLPRMRPVHSHIRRTSASSLLSRVLSRGNSSSSRHTHTRKSNNSSGASQAPSTTSASTSTPTPTPTPFLPASSSRGGKTPASPEGGIEILSPVPRRAGRMFSQLWISPFERSQAGMGNPVGRVEEGVSVERHNSNRKRTGERK